MSSSTTPVPKVAAAGAAGAVATLIVVVMEASGVSVPPEMAAAIATVIAFVGGYLKP